MALLPRITRILGRTPAATFAQGITESGHLGAPDASLTLQQHAAYMETLRNLGLEVTVLPADERYPDGHYVEDPAVIFRDMVFFCRSGAEARRGEADGLAAALSDLRQVRVTGEDAFIDGGDVLFCADRVLIGLSQRTTHAGAEELAAALRSVQADLRVEFVPFTGVLHLKTGMTELAPGLMVKSPFMQTDHPLDFAEVITLPEAESYAADVLPINDVLILPAGGYPTVQALAEKHYQQIIRVEMSEFEKMDGGLTCLSLRY